MSAAISCLLKLAIPKTLLVKRVQMEPAKAPRVFISYSWESEDHKRWVRHLGERLYHVGIEARLDQWFVRPGESFTVFMEQEVEKADFVLVVCTPAYAHKSNKRHGGVGYEQQIVSGQLMSGIPRSKFIPILKKGDYEPGPECAIPTHFLGIAWIDFRDDASFEASLEDLIRVIFSKPRFAPPPLGAPPPLDTSSTTVLNQNKLFGIDLKSDSSDLQKDKGDIVKTDDRSKINDASTGANNAAFSAPDLEPSNAATADQLDNVVAYDKRETASDDDSLHSQSNSAASAEVLETCESLPTSPTPDLNTLDDQKGNIVRAAPTEGSDTTAEVDDITSSPPSFRAEVLLENNDDYSNPKSTYTEERRPGQANHSGSSLTFTSSTFASSSSPKKKGHLITLRSHPTRWKMIGLLTLFLFLIALSLLWWSGRGGRAITLQGHIYSVESVAFSPDGKTLASGSRDRTIKLWDVQTRQELATLRGHNDHIKSVAFSPDGKTLASGSRDRTIKLWDVQTKQELATLKLRYDVYSVTFSPDGKMLASSGGSQGGRTRSSSYGMYRPEGS